jgi:hypothetical protein
MLLGWPYPRGLCADITANVAMQSLLLSSRQPAEAHTGPLTLWEGTWSGSTCSATSRICLATAMRPNSSSICAQACSQHTTWQHGWRQQQWKQVGQHLSTRAPADKHSNNCKPQKDTAHLGQIWLVVGINWTQVNRVMASY